MLLLKSDMTVLELIFIELLLLLGNSRLLWKYLTGCVNMYKLVANIFKNTSRARILIGILVQQWAKILKYNRDSMHITSFCLEYPSGQYFGQNCHNIFTFPY